MSKSEKANQDAVPEITAESQTGAISIEHTLLKLNVNDHTEKKNGLTYLSWAWAWAEVLKIDPQATWEPINFAGQGEAFQMLCRMDDATALVGVDATIKGITRRCLLPVMDHKNKAIPKPNAFDVNKAQMRCLAKAIAMHGLGLYIYAGEDLPEADEAPAPKKTGAMADTIATLPPLSQEDKLYFDEMAQDVEAVFASSGQSDAFERVEIEQLDNEQKLHLWSRLGSKVRAALKVEKGLRIGAA